MPHKLLIQFPTRGRPEQFGNVLLQYIDMLADKENYHINVNCDCDDVSMCLRTDWLVRVACATRKMSIHFSSNKSKVEAINRHIDGREFDIVLLASDDMIPQVRGYDDVIRQQMDLHFPDLDGVLWFHDGRRRDLNTIALMGRKYFDRFGYIYHPDYKSLWADNELQDVAAILGKQVFVDQVILKHEHFSYGAAQLDETYRKSESDYLDDERTYRRRKLTRDAAITNFVSCVTGVDRPNLRDLFPPTQLGEDLGSNHEAGQAKDSGRGSDTGPSVGSVQATG